MNVLAIIGSATGEMSMGKAVLNKVIEYTLEHKNVEFEYDEIVYNKTKNVNIEEKLKNADFLIFTTSPFHCALQSGFSKFITENCSNDIIRNKPAVIFTSSSGLLEKNCEAQLRAILADLGVHVVSGYSSIEYEFLENHNKPTDVNIRTGNSINDMSQWLCSCIIAVNESKEPTVLTSSEKMLIITSLQNDDAYLKEAIAAIKSKYENTDIINLNDYNLKDCMGCKYCYTSKKCCIKDDMLQLENKVAEYSGSIHIIEIQHGAPDPLYMSFVQRDIHRGFNPIAETVGKKVIRIIKSNDYDMSLTKEYFTSLSSYGRLFSVVLIDGDIKDFVLQDSILEYQMEGKTMPNMDGYCKLYTRHFDNLSHMLRNLLQPDFEFFKNHPYAKPSPVNEQARPIKTMEDAKMAQIGRLMPVTEFMKPKKKGLFDKWKN